MLFPLTIVGGLASIAAVAAAATAIGREVRYRRRLRTIVADAQLAEREARRLARRAP